ncbi:MAG TPA: S8 family serine peptidase [Mycobacteriales bacterium]|jgi:subtilisin family serine protease|nr:S8 family serine peptidase [Mycobacteriales bacterium]
MSTPNPGEPVNASRDRRFLIAQNDNIALAGAQPLEFDWLVEQMRTDPAITVNAVLAPRSLTLQSAGPSVLRTVVVASMPEEKAAQLEAHPQVVLEEDLPLGPLPAPPPTAADVVAGPDPGLVSPFGTSTAWQLRLTSPEGVPVPDATVYLYGRGIPTQGRTDANGMVTLSLLNETDATIAAVYVDPLRDYWSLWVTRPALTSGTVSTLTLSPLSQSFAGFPGAQVLGWGQQAMRLDQVPAALDGQGVKVVVVDSGVASLTHADLGAITHGVDLTTEPSNPAHWTDDTMAHGSHCSGIIAGADNGIGVRGFAPAAEVHEARIFPGGRISSLLDAVDYCIDEAIDVANMSLGTGGSSQILLQKLAQAKQQGVAFVVAAGNSGDGVQFPGSSPDVLTVSAIGKEGTFPESSYHAQVRLPGGRQDDGYFGAKFSCHGPEVDVCGPGVAIVSSVPADGYASWDGTSMATPHVAGLATLVLAHHPDFQQPGLRLRTAARVDRLFDILRQSATPIDLGDPSRTGAGLPDAVRALALDTAGSQDGTPEAAAMARDSIRAALAQVQQELSLAGLLDGLTPAAATPPAGPVRESVADLRRSLLSVRAQLTHAGLAVE